MTHVTPTGTAAVTAPPPLLYLDGAHVDRLCAELPVVDLVHETLLSVRRGEAGLSAETALRWSTSSGASARSLVLPAWSGDNYGCKIINAALDNHTRGLPRAAGLIVLNDPDTARPICLMEGARISALRTAGVSLAAVRAVRDLDAITSTAFLGCGRQAEVHHELLLRHCPALREILLHDTDADRAAQLAAAWNTSGGSVRATVVASPREAVERAALTIAVTTTTEPYVEFDWLPPGGTFVNVSLDDAAESLLLGCDRLFVDSWELVVQDEHRLLGVLARAGRVSGPGRPAPAGGRAVDAELPDLLSRAHPPVERHERVVINPFGMGVHDITLAAAVRARAAEQHLGIRLPL